MAFSSPALHIISLVLTILIILPILTQASPFDFVNNLKGCHKGSQVKGVNDLKQYLQQFGYLNYPSGANTHDDHFDDFLEHSVKTYQSNYLLNITGTLDDETISAMTTPRCGNLDIINGTNWMQYGNHHKHGNNMFHQVEHFSFRPGFPSADKWPPNKRHLTYGFSPNVPVILRPAIVRAFRIWGAATRFSFSGASPLVSDIIVAFGRRNHGDRFPFDGRGGVIAHAFLPTDGRFHFDADESWSIGAMPRSYDVTTVALHGIGHLLGLGHSRERNAIMFAFIPTNTVKGLHADDINAIRRLYG